MGRKYEKQSCVTPITQIFNVCYAMAGESDEVGKLFLLILQL